MPDKKYYKENYLFNHYPPGANLHGLRCYAYYDSIFKPGFRSTSGYNCPYGVITLIVSGEYKTRHVDSNLFNTRKTGLFSISLPGSSNHEILVTGKEPCIRKGLLIYPTEEYLMIFRQYFPTQNSASVMLPDMEPVIKLFDQIRDEIKNTSGIQNDIRIAGLLMEMIETVSALQNLKQATYPPDFEQILQYIKKHFTDPGFSREQIAHAAGISVRSLSRMFQKYMQMGISQYIMECRLKRTADMLSLTTLRINEIADQCGFGSAIYLARAFKAHYKMTPKTYRLKSCIRH
jgi:AraC-like DNA-binding protein